MRFGIGIYDALVSANVSPEKAKAVVAELKREMMDELATKNDIHVLALSTKKDIENLALSTKKDIEYLALSTKKDFEAFELKLTIKLGLIVLACMGFITTIQNFFFK